LLPCELLPTLHDDIAVLRVDLQAVADALQFLCRDQRGSGSEKRIIDRVAALGVIEQRWEKFTGRRAGLADDGRTFEQVAADRSMEAAA